MSLMCGNVSSSNQSVSFVRQMERFVGETVTIFTASGGASGSGFTGVILSVNRNFVRLVTDIGTAPANPLSTNVSSDMNNGSTLIGARNTSTNALLRSTSNGQSASRAVGSVVDIPVDRIVAFCHNAV